MLVTSQGTEVEEGVARLVMGQGPPEDAEGGRRRASRHLHILLISGGATPAGKGDDAALLMLVHMQVSESSTMHCMMTVGDLCKTMLLSIGIMVILKRVNQSSVRLYCYSGR